VQHRETQCFQAIQSKHPYSLSGQGHPADNIDYVSFGRHLLSPALPLMAFAR
jgi:hypothetical protein